MKIVVAPDSFKGSITSLEATKVIEHESLEVDATFQVICKPMADGGEGTLESLIGSTTGKKIPINCTGPLGKQIDTYYGILDSRTAVIEGAAISGLVQVPKSKRNPDNTTSYGIGEAILDALDNGCTSFIIGIGGSATNDGGLGMLQALGMKAFDSNGNSLSIFGRDLNHIHKLDVTELDSRLSKVEIKTASDVDNPLCGENGASAVYGPQKGATFVQVTQYDAALDSYSNKLESILRKSYKYEKGAGAAGGLGFALLAIGAELVSGAQLVADAHRLEMAVQSADLVITGEGQSDEQTLYGKAPSFIAGIAQKYGVPTILLSGSITGDVNAVREKFAGCFSIVSRPLSLEECMENAASLLSEQTKQIVHLIKIIRNGA